MDNDRELNWDDEILEESSFTLLPEGDYDFTVKSFKRSRHLGSAKLPACNKAEIEITVDDGEGNRGTIFHNLFLHTKCEGILSAFFISLGLKKHGEPLRMNWSAVIGAKGRCKVTVDKWTGNDGSERQNNKIIKFYEPAQTNVNTTTPQTNFKAGTF